MNENIRQILSVIARLEEEPATMLHEQQEQLNYRIKGSKIRFEENLHVFTANSKRVLECARTVHEHSCRLSMPYRAARDIFNQG